jgi:hypothetical protein
MNYKEISELESRYLVHTYDRMPFLAVKGEGCYLYDDTGKKYLDFLGGLAVNSLGYAHPELMAVVRDEAAARFQPDLSRLPGTTGGKARTDFGTRPGVFCQHRHGSRGGCDQACARLRAKESSCGAV